MPYLAVGLVKTLNGMKAFALLIILAAAFFFIKLATNPVIEVKKRPPKRKRGPQNAITSNESICLNAVEMVEQYDPVEVVLLSETKKPRKSFSRNALNDVLYEGVLVTIDGQPPIMWVVLHFFDNGNVKLLRDDSKENITTTAHIDTLRPVISV